MKNTTAASQYSPAAKQSVDEPVSLANADLGIQAPRRAGAIDEIPLLNDLSTEFRRQVPSLNINVFVYSQNAADRFVIIDMIKYRAGEKLASGLVVGEIRSDSVVLQYQGRKFRINRP